MLCRSILSSLLVPFGVIRPFSTIPITRCYPSFVSPVLELEVAAKHRQDLRLTTVNLTASIAVLTTAQSRIHSTMSYAAAAARGAKQSPEEVSLIGPRFLESYHRSLTCSLIGVSSSS